MKKAVIYGAGNIGRGFLGQLLYESDYDIVFIEVDAELVNQINRNRTYPIRIVSNDSTEEIEIKNVRAVNGFNRQLVESEISKAEVMFTAVGVPILPYIAEPIARGICERWVSGNLTPLNIIICENLINADVVLKTLVNKEMRKIWAHTAYKKLFESMVGFVLASIGRMVPVMTPDLLEDNPLLICVEAYKKLPVDLEGIRGKVPDIINLIPYTPFDYYIHRKLYIHNMGHAITAYLGKLKGYTYIWEALEDQEIVSIVTEAMMASAEALAMEHRADIAELTAEVQDLIGRFKNKQLGDTIERVGRDLERKLSPGDRLIGALNMCIKNNVNTEAILEGIVAAFRFKDTVQSQTTHLLNEGNFEKVLRDICGIHPDTKTYMRIVDQLKVERCHYKNIYS